MSAPLIGWGFFGGDFFQCYMTAAISDVEGVGRWIVLIAQQQWTATTANVCVSICLPACLLPSSTQPAVRFTLSIRFENHEVLFIHEN